MDSEQIRVSWVSVYRKQRITSPQILSISSLIPTKHPHFLTDTRVPTENRFAVCGVLLTVQTSLNWSFSTLLQSHPVSRTFCLLQASVEEERR